MTAEFLAFVVALIASLLVTLTAVKFLFRGAVVRAKRWVAPKEPTPLDVLMSELGNEVVHWKFARVTLIAVLVPIFFLLIHTFVQSVASSLGV
jgi:hypothetical protein